MVVDGSMDTYIYLDRNQFQRRPVFFFMHAQRNLSYHLI